ncbi:MAG TPA: hypothetical protein VFJ43_06850, partial [Bacteroidia bacterium]|nr:hypothetical protein [Bacteroidia bacterium]
MYYYYYLLINCIYIDSAQSLSGTYLSAILSAIVSAFIIFLLTSKKHYISRMIKIDASKAQSSLRQMQVLIGGKEFQQAAARAINHTISKLKTAVNSSIRDSYKIPSNEISNRLFIQHASSSTLQ